MYYFVNAKQAMAWSTEVLRKRRFAQNGVFYMSAADDEEGEFYGTAGGSLPQAYDERALLATRVQGLLNSVDEQYREALLHLFWGDYLHEDGYRKATFVQEYLRQKGIRTRLSYRYSYRQVGNRLGVDHKTVRRWEEQGLNQLQTALQRFGLLEDSAPETLSA
jgi:DNA-directed RNA polymerase specialized sigma24 family protein